MAKKAAGKGELAPQMIDERIASLGDWRGKTLARMRKLIRRADPEVVEEWKWMGTPVWEHDGIICTGESYKAVQMMPSCSQTGVPIHFHSSTTSGSASLMSLRIRASVLPRQSPRLAI